MSTARRLRESRHRAHAASALVPRLSESQLSELLEIIQGIEDSFWHDSALADVCGRVGELLSPRQALDIIRDIESKPLRANALRAVAGHLDERLLGEALMLTDALHPSSTERFHRNVEVFLGGDRWSSEKLRVSWSPQVAALSALAPNAPPSFRAEIYEMWQEVLRRLAGEERKDSLTQLAMLSSVLDRQGGAPALVACARVVKDVTRWWP